LCATVFSGPGRFLQRTQHQSESGKSTPRRGRRCTAWCRGLLPVDQSAYRGQGHQPPWARGDEDVCDLVGKQNYVTFKEGALCQTNLAITKDELFFFRILKLLSLTQEIRRRFEKLDKRLFAEADKELPKITPFYELLEASDFASKFIDLPSHISTP